MPFFIMSKMLKKHANSKSESEISKTIMLIIKYGLLNKYLKFDKTGNR